MTSRTIKAVQAAVGVTADGVNGPATKAAVAAWQAAHGLDADGIPGPHTLQAMGIVVEDVPDGRAATDAYYGPLPYTDGAGGRINVDPAWDAANIVFATMHTGHRVRLHKLVADEFVAVFKAACDASGYTPAQVQTYVPRHMLWDPAKPVSMHSYGIAVDFDPALNHNGAAPGTAKLDAFPDFVQAFRDAGWAWGGDWHMRDTMHFQRAQP